MSNTQTKKESRKRVLTLEVEGGGRTFDFSSQKLQLTPEDEPIIKLHFLRFGVFEYDNDKLIKVKAQPQDTEPVIEGKNGELYTNEKGATQELDEVIITEPHLDNFFAVRTGIKAGYLYILDEANPDTPIEYKISESGSLSSISWKEKKDFREVDGKISGRDYHEAEYNSVLWVGYSPIQWSLDFYNRLKNSVGDRKIYMKKVVCTGFKEGDNLSGEYMSAENTLAYFKEEDQSKATSLTNKLDAIVCKEISDKEVQLKKRPDKEFIKPNMIITLEDPINNLFYISNSLASKTLEFRALIDAIQSGETLEMALQRLKSGNDTPPEPHEDYGSLFSLALTSYQIVYANKDSKKKYDGGVIGWSKKKESNLKVNPRVAARRNFKKPGQDIKGWTGGLDLAKVEAVLGYEDRQKFREIVQGYRNDYATYIGCKSCKEHFEYYLHNHPERTLQGCATIFDTIMSFYPNPYNWDKHLLLKKDYKSEDALQEWVYKLLDDEQQYTITLTNEESVNSKAPNYAGNDVLYALLTKPIDLEKPIEDDPLKYSLGISGVLKAKLQVHSDEVFNTRNVKGKTYKTIKDKHTFVKKKINKKFKLGKKLVKMKGNQMYLNPELFTKHASIDWEEVAKNKYTGKKKKITKILKKYNGLVYIGKVNGKHVFEIPYEKSGDKLSKPEIKKNNLNKKAAVVLNSRAFNGTIAFLQVLNMKGALESFIEAPNAKSLINLGGVSTELTEAVLTLKELQLKASGVESKMLSNTIRVAGTIGGAVSAGICFYEGIVLLNKRDNDSGLALMGAGVAFGYGAYFAFAAVSGPIVWIVLGIGVGLVLLSEWLRDTPLEYFFKNFLLSDAHRLPRKAIDQETPMAFNRRLFDNKEELVDNREDKKTIMHPKDALATLSDAIVCHSIMFRPGEDIQRIKNRPVYSGTPGSGINTYKVTIYEFKVTLRFYELFNDKDQYEHRIFLFPNGLKSKTCHEITNTHYKNNIIENGITAGVSVSFNIPTKYRHLINEDTEVVYAAQLYVDKENNIKFPYPRANKERYMGARIKLTNTEIMLENSDQEENLKNLPLNELLNHDTW
ncbi:hypothetical protein SAMN05421766_10718 [Zobellia uliginosa]|uniref:Toxin VasX N-terminal region domain-containing protein n=1 Tax=Zobellia uliginosa TaxID=143224 RepID=A0ABY1L0E0_9FLAO|nr:toxin VasX [Zobellia uliginosa]SIT01408.1 hypothetical protein SAMN05421766_10718 [Zobellia uliginosa]